MLNRSLIKYLLPIYMAAIPHITLADTLLGVYYGNQGWNVEQIKAMESWQGKRHAVITLFTDWSNSTSVMDNLFKQQLPNIWKNGNVPMITWEPYTSGSTTPTDITKRIAIGEYDAYIETWANRLKIFLSGPDGIYNTADDRRVYLRLAHEMNGNWYPWSASLGNSDPLDFIDMWRRVVSIFDNKGLDFTHLQWVWCVNSTDIGTYTAEQFYPGDSFVHWIAIDGYNWGSSQTWSTWKSPSAIYDNMIGRIRALSVRPVALAEFATTSSRPFGSSMADKLTWINEMFTYAANEDIRLVSWFNQDKTVDWAIFGGINGDGKYTYLTKPYKTYSSYKASVQAPNFISSDTVNVRLLTDAQFAGE